MNNLKIAYIKSVVHHDLWLHTITKDPFDILKTTIVRVPPLGLAEHFNTDFIIIKEIPNYTHFFESSDFNINSYENKSKILPFLHEEYHKNITAADISVDVNQIDFNNYNIVICLNQCIPPNIIDKYRHILWCYLDGENYNNNLFQGTIVNQNYDIFLNQQVQIKNFPPNIIGFPYTFLHPYTLENINKTYLDNNISEKYGIYMEINNTTERPVKNIPDEFTKISTFVNIPIIIHQQDILKNIKNIFKSKYFIKLLGRQIRGNSILEAISCGTLVLIKKDLIMHTDLIPEFCYIANEDEIIEKILFFESCPEEYDNYLTIQRANMQQFYFDQPIQNLFNAYLHKIKKNENH